MTYNLFVKIDGGIHLTFTLYFVDGIKVVQVCIWINISHQQVIGFLETRLKRVTKLNFEAFFSFNIINFILQSLPLLSVHGKLALHQLLILSIGHFKIYWGMTVA